MARLKKVLSLLGDISLLLLLLRCVSVSAQGECDAGLCDPNALCDDVEGTCTCFMGFTGDGFTCQNIDECDAGDFPCNLNAVCLDTIGSFTCTCTEGFTGDGMDCTSTTMNDGGGENNSSSGEYGGGESGGNETYSGESESGENGSGGIRCSPPCGNNEICAEFDGTSSYACVCDEGFFRNGSVCENIDECASETTRCGSHGNCTDTIGSFNCTCEWGYYDSGSGCEDINECYYGQHHTGTQVCHENATCHNVEGLFHCFCESGLIGNGYTQCDIENGSCPSRNEFHCPMTTVCLPHFTLCNGRDNCGTNFDESDHLCNGCPPNMVNCHSDNSSECVAATDLCDGINDCSNYFDEIGDLCGVLDPFPSSRCPLHMASCQSDNTLECVSILDICDGVQDCSNNYDENEESCNHCNPNPCGSNETCHEFGNSYTCLCNEGFFRDGSTCENINECANETYPCNTNAFCTDTIGSFDCTCVNGFSGNGFECEDINECLGINFCHENATCSNTEGSYTCQCNEGFFRSGSICENINECVNGTFPCNDSAYCIDSIGSFDCSCHYGYTGDGYFCNDINECDLELHSCHENATCSNYDGYYICSCNNGSIGDGYNYCNSESNGCHFPHDFHCPMTTLCLYNYLLCDGYDDCGTNFDESSFICDGCPPFAVSCQNDNSFECIHTWYLCDGIFHCSNGFDETGDLCGVFNPFSMVPQLPAGSGMLHFACSENISSLSLEMFSPLRSLLNDLGCTSSRNFLLYTIEFRDRRVAVSEQNIDNFLVADIFEEGESIVQIRICRENFPQQNTCAEDSLPEEIINVSVTVSSTIGRLFPYGDMMEDSSFRNVLDGSVALYPPGNFPFFSNYYSSLHISSNGLVSLNQQYLSWWPIPFPFGLSVIPVIAPMWADFDFRNSLQTSKIYYQGYQDDGRPSRGRAILNELNKKLAARDFRAEWVAIITWNDAVPWPYWYWEYFYSETTTTFQLVLATDFVQTHAFFLYQDSTLVLFDWQRVVVGYDTRNFRTYNNLDYPAQQLAQLHGFVGNTGRVGDWHFNLTTPEDQLTAEQRCYIWAKRQQVSSIDTSSLAVQSCPCTLRQAWLDWRFWFLYYWGLSTQPNCATALFTRSQHALECCYDSFGALIVGPNTGGTFKLYNPLFFYQENFVEDLLPYYDCCIDSMRCQFYYAFRPFDNCSAYDPFIPRFMFGDPHLETIDGRTFTFNGIGEYIFIHTPAPLNFHVQARLQTFSSNSTGTVMTSVAVKLADLPAVQVLLDGSGELVVYVGGVFYELQASSTPLMVDSTGVSTIDPAGGLGGTMGNSMAMATSTEQITVMMDATNGIVISTGGEASITVTVQDSFLGLSVTLPDNFRNMTSGLLGVFNGDPDDDFRDRDGNVLQLQTEREIYEQFGLLWHLSEHETFFNYSIEDTSYSAINDGYMDHEPHFLEELNATQEVIEMCQGNRACIYDATVTGNTDIGKSTLGVSMSNNEIIRTMNNTPPTLDGDFTLYATADIPATATFQAQDSDQIHTLSCPDVPEGFLCDRSSDTLQVYWENPQAPFPDTPLRIFANDSYGAPTTRIVSVVLCQCYNDGNCSMDNSTLEMAPFDQNGYYQWPCRCPSFFSGASCEVDERGCGPFSTCPDYSVCVNDSSKESGYSCADCQTGYTMSSDGDKCADVNECNSTETHNCSQVCTNTDGSYTCSCFSGYTLSNDSTVCIDVDECSLGNANCSQLCNNTDGSYECECEPGFTLSMDGTTCLPDNCSTNLCGPLDCVMVNEQYECICDPGQRCNMELPNSVCNSSVPNDLMNGVQVCEDCPPNTYGLRCSQTCSCGDNGYCDMTTGCVCNDSWTGIDCSQELNRFRPFFDSDTPTAIEIRWDLMRDAAIATITARDNDTGPNSGHIHYSLSAPPYSLPEGISSGVDVFHVDSMSGVITLQAVTLEEFIETVAEFVLTIVASDEGQPSLSTSHTLTLQPVPVPIFQNQTREVVIDEELVLGTTIAQLECTEIGPSSDSTQITLSGSGSEGFRIERGSEVIVSRRIDYETLSEDEREFIITATCTNRYNLTDSIPISVSIRNTDDNPFGFRFRRYTASVREDVTTGKLHVLTVQAFDRDVPNANVIYSLEASEDASDFFIFPQTGEIFVHSNLDRETKSHYQFFVLASYATAYGSVQNADAEVTVTISDVNDERPEFEETAYFVTNITTQNDIGDFVVMVTASDADAGSNGHVTYQLERNSSAFEINEETGVIFIAFPPAPALHVLTVIATDNGTTPLSSSALVYINVQLYHDDIILTPSEMIISIPEDTPIRSLIGNISATLVSDINGAPDVIPNEVVTFQILNASTPNSFIIDETTGEIYTLLNWDYETLAREYFLVIEATLNSSLQEITREIHLSVQIENVNDNPPMFSSSLYSTVVEQLIFPNTTILTVSAADPDELNSIEYSLQGPDSSFFQINPTTGRVSAVMELDMPREYRFQAVASDGGLETSSATIFISATLLVSVAPTFTSSSFDFSVTESAAPGTIVGTVTIVTRQNVASVDFSEIGIRISQLAANASEIPFHIDSESGNISTRAILDFESQQDHLFQVEVYNPDNGSMYDTAMVAIHLEDVNDNPPVFDQSLYTHIINASLPLNSSIAIVTATDQDSESNGLITYTFEDPRNSRLGFALNFTTGEIIVSNSTLIPGDYYLGIVASDGGSPVMTATTTIFIGVIPIIPSSIQFTQQRYRFQIVEDDEPDTLLGTIQALDSTTSLVPPGIIYTISNTTDCFSVDALSGEVKLSCTSLDREDVANYELETIARVGATTTQGALVIDVLDINDNAPVFSPDIYNVAIDDRFGNTSAMLTVHAMDTDFGDNGTIDYSLLSETDSFRISSSTGDIFLIDPTVDIGAYRLIIEATDRGAPLRMSSTALVFVTVTRAHPPTLQFASDTFNVTENSRPGTVIGTVALTTSDGDSINPLEFPDNLQFQIIGGSSSDLFLIDEQTGLLRTQTQNLDREEASQHVIEILANFTQFSHIAPMPAITGTFVINVLDVNDNAPVMLTTYATRIDDSARSGDIIFNITATDIDAEPNATVTFSINPQPPTLFDVRVTDRSLPQTHGTISVNQVDFLIPGTYQFTLTASDNGEPSLQRTAVVEIIVEHAIPETIAFSNSSYTFGIMEETPERTFVGNVSIFQDTPALDDLVYGITGGSGVGFFNLNPRTGEIVKNHRRLNREQEDAFTLDIAAYLPNQIPPLTASTNVIINIVDINDHFPRFTEGIYPSVGVDTDELNPSVPLITVLASDMDIGSNARLEYRIHSFEINQSESTNPSSLFTLNITSGELFAALTEVPIGVYAFNISASDQGQPMPLTSYTSVTIVVTLPAPTAISFTRPNGYTLRLRENSGITRVGQVVLADIPEYLLQYVTYTTQSQHFTIALHTGDITSRQDFDFELETEFNFVVTSTFVVTNRIPRIDLSAVVNVTVEIVDVNDNTPFFIDFPTEITQYEERETAEVVHTILANDSDSGSNSMLTYTILNNDLNGLVTINNMTGELIAAAGLDRENATQAHTHTISIRVCDNGEITRCVMNTTQFRLLDINDNNPRLISGFVYRVEERLPAGTEVFSFEGADPDVGANSTIRYSLNSTNAPFICNETTGQVTLREELDYESISSYDIMLMLRDTGNPILSTQYTNITVNVVNMPDNTPRFNQTQYSTTTDPTVLNSDVLFQVQASDADSNDILHYAITNIQETGNNATLPQLRVEPTTGQVLSTADQVFITEAVFTVSILVYDQSAFNLTNTTVLVITVVPNSLAFTQPEYNITISEDTPRGSNVIALEIETLSASSDIRYTFDVIEPVNDDVTFRASGNGRPVVTISLATLGTGLDRERIDRYVLDISASRPNEVARARLVVLVSDVNDNPPSFLDSNGTVAYIAEDATTPTMVTRSNATDADIGDNARLEFSIINRDLPFDINSETGVISTRGILDYETVQSYNVIVSVRDYGTPRLESRIFYTFNIVNVNDEFPQFAAPAYFGEVYARAPSNDFVLHTELRVSDADDVNNEQVLTFRIYSQNQQLQDYQFRVESMPPYRIVVDSLPEEANSSPRLLELTLEVADEGNKQARVPLYISVFTSNNLGFFLLEGVDADTLLSCAERASSMCAFRETLADLLRDAGSPVQITFYNNTVESLGIQSVQVGVYGWYGNTQLSRNNRGELATSSTIQPVQYVTYDEARFREASQSTQLEFLSFAVTLQEKEPTEATTVDVEEPTELNTTLILAVGASAVVAVLMVLLVFALVCVFGRRRKDRPKKPDPYEKTMMNRYLRESRMTQSSSDDIPLHKTALETLYDDDDIIDTAQTMPWFDPSYLADEHDDPEQLPYRSPMDRPAVPVNLRATVDGNARRGLSRHSSHESQRSQNHTRYQHSTPIQHHPLPGLHRNPDRSFSSRAPPQPPPPGHRQQQHSHSHQQFNHHGNQRPSSWLPPYQN